MDEFVRLSQQADAIHARMNEIKKEVFGPDAIPIEQPSHSSIVTESAEPFPRKAKSDEKIVWLFKHVLKKPALMPEFKEASDQYASKDLYNQLRYCVAKGLVVKAQPPSGRKVFTYYGLPEWTIKEKSVRRWKPEYTPYNPGVPKDTVWKFES